ncbi:MAG: glycosyltransferase [Hyphomonadaceae bacterium]|nr:glycosyltransferase [Hyphomonadaceae bacterium]
MTTLGIFTVKTFYRCQGRFYTNGGFGKYLAAMCAEFAHVIMLCKVRRGPPPGGFYLVQHDNLEIVPVPAWPTELGALLVQPLVFSKGIGLARRADVIHARMPDWTGITGALAARCTRTPCFHQIIGDTAGLARTIPPTKKFGLGAALRMSLLLYDALERQISRGQLVFAQGQLAYEKHSRASERILVLSSAHHIRDIGRHIPRFQGTCFTILNVGRLQSVKNQQLLIRALEILRRDDPRWRLRIVGEGPKRNELEALARDLGVAEAVSLPGLIDHGTALWTEYDQADVFVLSSVSEGTPKVVLEAMARSCPVIASDIGGIRTAVVDGERGLLFGSEDIQGLTHALRRIATESLLRDKLQEAALLFSREHTVEQSTASMMRRVIARWPHLQPLRT